MKLLLVGCSHHNAPIEVREKLAFDQSQAAVALARWNAEFPHTEAVLLSTCNRVELYTATPLASEGPNTQQVVKFLANFHGESSQSAAEQLVEHTGDKAVRHLFTVASSLDSMVLGEPQIVAQVKQAYALAQQCESAGPLIHDLFQSALHTAKRVAGETSINEKRVSIPSIAVTDFARQIFDRFDDKQILVIGAGEMADETLAYLRGEGAKHITVINRSFERGRELAEKYSGQAAAWDTLSDQLIAADLIISTTGAHDPIVTLESYKQIEEARFQRPLVVLDLAVPRDFDLRVGERLNVYLYSIDDLQAACEQNRQLRDRELPAAMAIVDQEISKFMTNLNHRATRPVIQRLRTGWESVREQELKRLYNKLPNLDDNMREEIEQAFERFVNKVLHPPMESLRDESKNGTPHGLIDAFKRLFRLED
jgi:glutamyl-tRNA reductase